MGRILLVDTDQFVTLCAAGVLEEFAYTLGLSLADLRRLHALPFQLTKGRLAHRIPEHLRPGMKVLADSVPALTERPDDIESINSLIRANIEGGEAMLFAELAANPSWLMTTKDARCLRALSNAEDLSEFRERIAGRIIPFELSVQMLLDRLGHDETWKRFSQTRGVDQKVDRIFSTAAQSQPESVVQGIRSYLDDLLARIDASLVYVYAQPTD